MFGVGRVLKISDFICQDDSSNTLKESSYLSLQLKCSKRAIRESDTNIYNISSLGQRQTGGTL